MQRAAFIRLCTACAALALCSPALADEALGSGLMPRPADSLGWSAGSAGFDRWRNPERFDARRAEGFSLASREHGATPLSPQREVAGYWSYRLDRAWRAQTYVSKGLATGGPEWGLGASLGYAF